LLAPVFLAYLYYNRNGLFWSSPEFTIARAFIVVVARPIFSDLIRGQILDSETMVRSLGIPVRFWGPAIITVGATTVIQATMAFTVKLRILA
jgi:hypothetical protein